MLVFRNITLDPSWLSLSKLSSSPTLRGPLEYFIIFDESQAQHITRYMRVATRRWRIKFMTYAIIMFEVWPPYVNRCECFDRGREIRAIDRISNMFRSKEFVEICSVHGPRFVFVSGLIFY